MAEYELGVAHYKWCATSDNVEAIPTGVLLDENEVTRLRDEILAEVGSDINNEMALIYLRHAIAERILSVNSDTVLGAVATHQDCHPSLLNLSSWVIPESTELGATIVNSVEAWKKANSGR